MGTVGHLVTCRRRLLLWEALLDFPLSLENENLVTLRRRQSQGGNVIIEISYTDLFASCVLFIIL